MGIDETFELAFAKSQAAAGFSLPTTGNVFISVHDAYKDRIVDVARSFKKLGFSIFATSGTAERLAREGVQVGTVLKVSEGRPNVADAIMNRQIQLVLNVSLGRKPTRDAALLRRYALRAGVPYTTTIAAARAMAQAIGALQKSTLKVMTLQEYHGRRVEPGP
jgi:carbamoyl-phosphate synthase large subunit